MTERRAWTPNELLICLAYYSTLARGQRRSPPAWVIRELSELIGRTPGSISLRFANFNSVDPEFTGLGLKGMNGGGAHVQKIWNESSKNDGQLDQIRIIRGLAQALSKIVEAQVSQNPLED